MRFSCNMTCLNKQSISKWETNLTGTPKMFLMKIEICIGRLNFTRNGKILFKISGFPGISEKEIVQENRSLKVLF